MADNRTGTVLFEADGQRMTTDETTTAGTHTPPTKLGVQVAVDCTDPHALVRFWAEATGMEIDGRKAWATASACRAADGSPLGWCSNRFPSPRP